MPSSTTVARFDDGFVSAAITYYHQDHLSARVLTDSGGNVTARQGHFPYGESWYASGSSSKWLFTSYERDSESGNDYAMARFHVNRLGRFSSPDPLAGPIGDPQSLNRYAYTRSDAINTVDPIGLTFLFVDPSVVDGIIAHLLLQSTTVEVSTTLIDPGTIFAGSTEPRQPYKLLPNGDFDPGDLPITPREIHLVAALTPVPPSCETSLVQSLNDYLTAHNSPLAGQGQNLVDAGRASNVDPRLVVAIAGAETGFGNQVTSGQFNAWNWQYNRQDPRNSPFADWGQGINRVTTGLGGPHYLGGAATDTRGLYLGQHYCVGPDCVHGLANIDNFLSQQGGNPNALHFPCQ